jgi:hypothetical protein
MKKYSTTTEEGIRKGIIINTTLGEKKTGGFHAVQ